MIVAIFGIYNNSVDFGFSGSPLPQASVSLRDHSDPFSVTQALHNALHHLLVSPRGVSAVIIEPPLYPIALKQAIADFLLKKSKVNSVGFLQRSVCFIAGLGDQEGTIEPGAGLILDELEKIAIPVYDYRELTPFVRDCSDSFEENMISDSLAIDVRKPVLMNTQKYEGTQLQNKIIWQGASALTSLRKVWPLLTREQYKKGLRVWDSLYDMR